MSAIWAASAQQINQAQAADQFQQQTFAVVLDESFAKKYTPEKGIYLVTLLLAVIFEKQNVGDLNTLRSDQLRSGAIEKMDDSIAYTPKLIEQEFIKLNWSLKQMTYFSLRVRRWLSERNKKTVDGIGQSLYLVLQDIDTQASYFNSAAA
jgi:hypothetical protein